MEGNILITSIARSIGKEILDNSGNRCGSIRDFLVDHSRLSVRYVVLSEGASFNPGIEENYIVLPIGSINFENPEAEQVVLNVSAKKLEAIPKISKARFKNKEEDFLQVIEDFYGSTTNFSESGNVSENRSEDHQSHEGSAESAESETVDYNSLGDEVNYDKIKGIDRKS